MLTSATTTSVEAIIPLRVRYCSEMNCQVVKDSIHRRPSWTTMYALGLGKATVGFATVAIAGRWKNKPTIIEFYVLPEHRGHAFRLFEALLQSSGVTTALPSNGAVLQQVTSDDDTRAAIADRQGGC